MAVIVADPVVGRYRYRNAGRARREAYRPGTVATLALLLLRVTVSTAGAGKDRFNCRFWVPVPLIVRLGGEKLIVAVGPEAALVTCTWPLAVGKPKADAVMLADPAPTPDT